MKKHNSLSKHPDLIAMDRKATIKKYSDFLTFWICQNDSKIFKIEISSNSTVGELLSEVKQRLAQNSKDFIGLVSRNGNEIIDYTLKIKSFSLSNYGNNLEFQVQRNEDVLNDNQQSLQDFQFLKLLGSGVSASVYLVRHKANGVLYALKQINKSYFRDFKRMEQVLRQRKIMIQLIVDIPFTSRLIGSFQSQKYLNLVLEYYPGGQMFLHLQRRRLTQEQAKLYVAQMIITFEKLHQKKIIYRDLKPENIMIDFEGHARLGDYGLCKINLEYYDLTYSYCGSQEYMAPEVRSQNGYNYSVDFYTLGSFAYELVNGVPPFYNNEPLCFSQNSTEEFAQMVNRLIESNMHKRLKSFTEIKKLKWFRNIDWKKVLDKKYEMPFKLDVAHNYIGEEFKNQVIDPDIQDQQKFDKLLECFYFLSTDKAGFSDCYGRKKGSMHKQSDSGSKRKRLSFESSNQNSRKSQKSKSSTNNKSTNKSASKQKNVFRRKVGPTTNIYTSENLAQKSSKKLFNSNNSSKSQKKNTSNSHNKSNNSSNKMTKASLVLKPSQEASHKLTMKKVKSSSGLLGGITSHNAFKKVTQLQNIFSPNKMKSPKKFRPGNASENNHHF